MSFYWTPYQKSDYLKVLTTLDTGVLSTDCGGTVVSDGTIAYVAGGLGLAVIDIAEPTAPKMMTTVDTGVLAHEKGGWIVKVGQHLFVAGSYGLAVVDCSDPANAKKVADAKTGVLESFGPGHITAHPEGKTAYVTGTQGVAIMDISDPLKPVKLATALNEWDNDNIKGNRGGRSALVGSLLYVAGCELAIVDVSDPAAPKKAGESPKWRAPNCNTEVLANMMGEQECCGFVTVAADEKSAYVVGGMGVRAIDTSNPSNPIKGALINTGVLTQKSGGHAQLVGEPGKEMLIVLGGLGIVLVDVSTDPAKPKVVGRATTTVSTKAGSGTFAIAGKYIFVAGGNGFAVMELDLDAKPSALAPAQVPAQVPAEPNQPKVSNDSGGSSGCCVLQ